MHSSISLLGAMALIGTAAAVPAPSVTEAPVNPLLEKRVDTNPSAPWVSVDDGGQPATTYTPHIATDKEGATYLADAPPPALTETVFVNTWYGKVGTTTQDQPAAPTATNKNKQGGFTRCHNKDGDNAPLCDPVADTALFENNIYYVTWDPDYYNKTESSDPKGSNATDVRIALRIDFFNRTKQDKPEGEWAKLDELNSVPASWGFSTLEVKSSYLKGESPHNVSITLLRSINGTDDSTRSTSFNATFERPQAPSPDSDHHKIDNQDLVIALPVTFGSIILLCVAVCLWNRKTRRINIGNIMSRNRHGYKPGRGATHRMFNRNKDESIHLQDRSRSPVFEYHDHVAPAPRRDSDLGSLAGSPVATTFDHNDTGRSNAFRDELRRQQDQRGGTGYAL